MGEVADIITGKEEGKTDLPSIQLRKVHFFNNMSGVKGGEHFKRIIECQVVKNKMEDVRFSGTRAETAGSVFIVDALESRRDIFGSTLKLLDLADNTFSETNGERLANTFKAGFGQNLVELNLRDCTLGDENGNLLFEFLGTKLRKLDVSGNELTVESVSALRKAVEKNVDLEILAVDENDEFESGGCVKLCKGLKGLKKLKELGMEGCGIKEKGAKALLALELEGLEVVKLDCNMFSNEIVEKLTEKFREKMKEFEDNISDEEEDYETEEEEEEGEGEVDELAAAVGKTTIE